MTRRIRTLLQMSQADCAAACLAMVSEAYGAGRPSWFWQDALGSGRDGTSVATIVRTAAAHGLPARAYCVNDLGAALRTAALPGVLHVDGNHFVVVTGIRGDRVSIVDPATGQARLPLAELSARTSGPLLLFRRDPHARPDAYDDRAAGLRLSLRGVVVRSTAGIRLQLLFCTAVMLTATFGPALVVRAAVDRALRPDGLGVAAVMMGAVVVGSAGFVGAQLLATMLQSGLVLHLRTRMDVRLMLAFVRSLLGKDLAFLEQRATGDILSRIAANAALRESLTLLLLAAGLHLPMTLIYAAAMFVVSPRLALIALGGAALQAGAAWLMGRRVDAAQRESLRADAELQIHSIDAINNYAVVKAMRLEADVARRWLDTFATSLSRGLRRDSALQILQAVIGSIQVAVPVLIVLTGVRLAGRGDIPLGSVLAMMTVAGIFLSTLGRLVTGAQSLYLIRGHLERLGDIVTGPAQRVAPPAAAVPTGCRGVGLRLGEVSHRYTAHGPRVLDDVSLEVRPGELLGVAGPSGGGKTTLAHLLLDLYTPSSGTVTRWLGGRIGEIRYAYVPQDPELFSGSVRDNVLAWRPGADDRDVWAALELAAVRRDVEAMPLGLDTPVGGRGLHLSGGQRQRLALARAFLVQPDLFVGDEPTSHLDPESEQAVLAALTGLGGTRVIVAHSAHVLSVCDRAIRLTAGRLTGEPDARSLAANDVREVYE